MKAPLKQLAPLLLLLLSSVLTGAQSKVVFLVRHAERASAAPDSLLSDAGQKRATCLASTLKDAGIQSIFTTPYQRTQQTAAPLARVLSIAPVSIASDDQNALVEKIRSASGNVLVVGHSDTLPGILQKLGIAQRVTIRSDEYDKLFVVIIAPDGAPAMTMLHYCEFTPQSQPVEMPMIRK